MSVHVPDTRARPHTRTHGQDVLYTECLTCNIRLFDYIPYSEPLSSTYLLGYDQEGPKWTPLRILYSPYSFVTLLILTSMLSLILAGIGFVVWALIIINTYYSTDYSSVDHLSPDYARPIWESGTTLAKMISSPFGSYVVSMLVIYGVYKAFSFWMTKKNEVRFSVGSVLGFTLLHLFVVCTVYAGMPEGKQMILALGTPSALVLFFHILSLLIYPLVLTLVARACGYGILSRSIENWSTRDIRVTVLADVMVGFFVFATLLLILAMLGLYTLTGLIVVLVVMSVVGWQGWIRTYSDIRKPLLVLDNHETGK